MVRVALFVGGWLDWGRVVDVRWDDWISLFV